MPKYAAGTKVSPEKTIQDIQKLVKNKGATGFGYMENGLTLQLVFALNERKLRFTAQIPSWEEFNSVTENVTKNVRAGGPGNWERARMTKDEIAAAYQQFQWSYWRSFLLVIKAKFESIESEIYSFDEAFMTEIITPNGMTVGEILKEQIPQMYATGEVPKLLMMGN